MLRSCEMMAQMLLSRCPMVWWDEIEDIQMTLSTTGILNMPLQNKMGHWNEENSVGKLSDFLLSRKDN